MDRQALIREGSKVVTPIIQLTKGLGPASILFGTFEENRAYLNERQSQWTGLRDELMVYANQHPSERVRKLAHEVEQVVWADLRSTAWLLTSLQRSETMEPYQDSERAHDDALDKTARLMDEIRRY